MAPVAILFREGRCQVGHLRPRDGAGRLNEVAVKHPFRNEYASPDNHVRMPDGPHHSEHLDLELVRRAAAGAKNAFGALFERYQHIVYRFARVMTGSPDAAEDVTQEVFVILIRDLQRYAPERSALSTYLYGIARNVSRDRARRERRFLSLTSLGRPAAAEPDTRDPHELIVDAQQAVQVRRALARVPVKYREVVILCDLHDLSYADVAAILRTSLAAVRSRLHRGRHLLRHRLQASDRRSTRQSASSLKYSV